VLPTRNGQHERNVEWLGSLRSTRTRLTSGGSDLKAGDGEIVATGEAYESKAGAKAGCEAVKNAAAGASVVEVDS
jgi:uncharacterized protein YegP (UPF0339 family)